MKTLRILFLLSMISYCTRSNALNREQKDFVLEMSFREKVRVKSAQLLNNNGSIIDADLKENTFVGQLDHYNVFTLSVTYISEVDRKEKYITESLFLQPGETKILFGKNPLKYTLDGPSSANHAIFKTLQKKDEELIAKMQKLSIRLNQLPETQHQKLQDSIGKLEHERKESLYGSFIRKNPHSIVSLYALNMYGYINMDNPLEVEQLVYVLTDSLQNTSEVDELKSRIEEAKKIMIGQQAPGISQPDTSGKLLSLAELRGQYVLIDFWASWCKPCRAQNPLLVKLYNKFRKRGFTILGVSLDAQKTAWVKAINDDKLGWLHVSDLKQWQNEAALIYKISSVPQNYLLDTTGKIIAKNLSDHELSKMLDRITSKQP